MEHDDLAFAFMTNGELAMIKLPYEVNMNLVAAMSQEERHIIQIVGILRAENMPIDDVLGYLSASARKTYSQIDAKFAGLLKEHGITTPRIKGVA